MWEEEGTLPFLTLTAPTLSMLTILTTRESLMVIRHTTASKKSQLCCCIPLEPDKGKCN